MPRLLISNSFREETIFEKFFGFIPIPERVRHLSLTIQHPNGAKEVVHFGTQKSYKSTGNLDTFVNLNESKFRGARASKIQELVNRLETEGYSVSTAQLALFMDLKIDRLIMERR